MQTLENVPCNEQLVSENESMKIRSKIVHIHIGGNCFKVCQQVLTTSSPYFEALFRFHHFDSSKDEYYIHINEELNNDDAICIMFDQVVLDYNKNRDNKVSTATTFQQHQQQRQSYSFSFDLLFDTLLLSSKYLFEQVEQYYSDMFMENIGKYCANYNVTDVIPALHSHSPSIGANDCDCSPSLNQLSLLELLRLAQAYHLHYFANKLNIMLTERRTLAWRRLRKLHFGYY